LSPRGRTHLISIDDGPFDKFRDREVLVVGVVTAGRDLVEGVLTTRIPVDGAAVAERLSDWIGKSRFRPVLRALLLNGITIAGLSVVDLPELSGRLRLPVISVHRRPPRNEEVKRALLAAGFPERMELLERAGPSSPLGKIGFAAAGIEREEAERLLLAERGRSHLPEGLRLAHLIAQGLVLGESKGRP
jgi:endonuclease V-like protein UPF0215 family